MLRKPGRFKVAVQVRPLEGYRLCSIGAGEVLVAAVDDSTRNVIVDAHTVAQILDDLCSGCLLDGFNMGYGHYWTFDDIGEV